VLLPPYDPFFQMRRRRRRIEESDLLPLLQVDYTYSEVCRPRAEAWPPAAA
jgi:hypothetical protein